jgi:hypothetical protein
MIWYDLTIPFPKIEILPTMRRALCEYSLIGWVAWSTYPKMSLCQSYVSSVGNQGCPARGPFSGHCILLPRELISSETNMLNYVGWYMSIVFVFLGRTYVIEHHTDLFSRDNLDFMLIVKLCYNLIKATLIKSSWVDQVISGATIPPTKDLVNSFVPLTSAADSWNCWWGGFL